MVITIGTTVIHIFPTGTLIEFADGPSVPGEPEDTDAYRETARAHGYGTDTLQLCIDHEVMHLVLGDWLDVESPTLRAVRYDQMDDDMEVRRLEEAAVLAVQRYARAVGADIVEAATRIVSNPRHL